MPYSLNHLLFISYADRRTKFVQCPTVWVKECHLVNAGNVSEFYHCMQLFERTFKTSHNSCVLRSLFLNLKSSDQINQTNSSSSVQVAKLGQFHTWLCQITVHSASLLLVHQGMINLFT